MRVECGTFDEFLEELKLEAAAHRIHENIVRVRVDRTPQQDEAVSFDVALLATALIKTTDGDWTLEYAGYCGEDRNQSKQSTGTMVSNAQRRKIEDVAEAYDLRIRGGKWEVW